jgi:hypothetical protein
MLPLRSIRNWFLSLRPCRPARRSRRRAHNSFVPPQSLEPRCLLVAPFSLTDNEQLLIELVNRARLDPAAEAARFSISLNSGLNPGELTAEPRPPLAPQQMLINAAFIHGADMLQRDYFSHTTLGTTKTSRERAVEQNYSGLVGENLSWGGSTVEIDRIEHVYERHEALFRSPGHRRNMLRSTYNELGVTVQYGVFTSGGTDYNASMVVQNFGTRGSKLCITGVVYADTTDNNSYDIGEAIRSGTISAVNLATSERLSTEIANSGGYALEVSPGDWSVEAIYDYSGFSVRSTSLVRVGSTNLKLDFERFSSGVTDPVVVSTDRTSLFEQGADSSVNLIVSQTAARNIPVTVQLSTTTPDALRIPATIVIPAGQLTASVRIEGIADDLIESAQTITITAFVPGLSSTATPLTILDRTAPRFPASTQLVQTARPLLTWSAVTNAATYEIWGDNTTTGQTRAAWAANLTTPSWLPTTDLGLGDWTFYVRATAADGRRSFWSLPSVRQVRPVPTLLNPSAPLLRSSAVLRWAELTGATAWDIWVDGLSPRVSRLVYQSDITGNSFKLPELPIGNYSWWARARNAARHYTPWTARGALTITDRVTGITSPAAEFSSELTLNWNPIPGATAYDVWVDDRTRNTSPAHRNQNVLTNSIRIPALLPAITRIWIRAKDNGGNWHQWNSPTDIAHQLPPAITSLTGTTSSSTTPISLKIAWTPVSSAAAYTLRIASFSDQEIYNAVNLPSPSHEVRITIPQGRYRVWLAAVDTAGTLRPATTPYEFQVTETSPSAQNPDSQLSPLLPPELPKLSQTSLAAKPGAPGHSLAAPARNEPPAPPTSEENISKSTSQRVAAMLTPIPQISPAALNFIDELFSRKSADFENPDQSSLSENLISHPSPTAKTPV